MAMSVCSTSSPCPSPTLSTLSSSLKTPHHLLLLHPNNDNTSSHRLTYNSPSSSSVHYDDAAMAEKRRNEWTKGCLVRRRKRRRRKGFERNEFGEDKSFPLMAAHYLTTKQEAEYTQFIKDGAKLEAMRKWILESSKHEPSVKQWADAVGMTGVHLDKILCGARESKGRLNHCYRRLVVSIASRYQGKGLSLQDLIQEGSIGLIRGAKKFDPEKGNKLSTYVYWWIRQAITKSIANNSRIIRLPGNMCEKLPRITEANAKLTKQLMRPPSHEEIADIVGIDVATIRLIFQRTRTLISLDQMVTTHGFMSLQDVIAGTEEMTPEAMVKKEEMKRELDKLLSELSERELHIIKLYYGLNGNVSWSYEDIGRVMGLSRERVRQINNGALLKLQKSNIVVNMKWYI